MRQCELMVLAAMLLGTLLLAYQVAYEVTKLWLCR